MKLTVTFDGDDRTLVKDEYLQAVVIDKDDALLVANAILEHYQGRPDAGLADAWTEGYEAARGSIYYVPNPYEETRP